MNKKSFQEIIKSEKPVLVDFYADWCGPCKIMAPILKEIKESVNENVTILKVDVDRNPKAANAYQVSSIPTLILFKNGEILWRNSGVISKTDLLKILEKYQ